MESGNPQLPPDGRNWLNGYLDDLSKRLGFKERGLIAPDFYQRVGHCIIVL
jgi:hypothetical protein